VCKLVITFLCRKRHQVECKNEINGAKNSNSNATDIHLVCPRIVVRFPLEERGFYLLRNVKAGPRARLAYFLVGNASFSYADKADRA